MTCQERRGYIMRTSKAVAASKDRAKPGVLRTEVVGLRCLPGFRKQLEFIAKTETRTPTQVIERALRDYAQKYGYEEFPER
jgi:hypothetical protein